MPTYLRPDLLTIDPAELCDYLLEAGVHSTINRGENALLIITDIDATEALTAFVPTTTQDSVTLISDYIPKIPTSAAIQLHLQHVKDFRQAVRDGTDDVITAAQTRHVIADIIDGLRLLDVRLNRDL